MASPRWAGEPSDARSSSFRCYAMDDRPPRHPRDRRVRNAVAPPDVRQALAGLPTSTVRLRRDQTTADRDDGIPTESRVGRRSGSSHAICCSLSRFDRPPARIDEYAIVASSSPAVTGRDSRPGPGARTATAQKTAIELPAGCTYLVERISRICDAIARRSRISVQLTRAYAFGSEPSGPLVEVEPTCPGGVKDDGNCRVDPGNFTPSLSQIRT